MPSYLHVKGELYFYGEYLLRGARIVIPKILHNRVIKIAHEGHQDVVTMKQGLVTKNRQ